MTIFEDEEGRLLLHAIAAWVDGHRAGWYAQPGLWGPNLHKQKFCEDLLCEQFMLFINKHGPDGYFGSLRGQVDAMILDAIEERERVSERARG